MSTERPNQNGQSDLDRGSRRRALLRINPSGMSSSTEEHPMPGPGSSSRKGMPLVYSGLGVSQNIPNPPWLRTLQTMPQGLRFPPSKLVLADAPFTELHRMVAPSNAGVIKISQVPYSTTRQDVIAFLGKNTHILRQPKCSPFHALHMIMDRESGKSTDCFVEVETQAEAVKVAHTLHRQKLVDQKVDVECSSQDELLFALFPRANHVQWRDGTPIVDLTPQEYVRGEKAAGFQGFLHPEEFALILRRVEKNLDSPSASRDPTSPHETLVSITHKYPWYAAKYVPIPERDRIYDYTFKLMESLVDEFGPETQSNQYTYGPREPSPALLQEMVTAALVCPGFSETQKAKIVSFLCPCPNGYRYMADGRNLKVQHGGTHDLAPFWPFAAVSITPGADITFVKFYGRLFHEATCARSPTGSLSRPMDDVQINYKGKDNPSDLLLATAATNELVAIEELVKNVLAFELDDELATFLCNPTIMPTSASMRRGSHATNALSAAGNVYHASRTERASQPKDARHSQSGNGKSTYPLGGRRSSVFPTPQRDQRSTQSPPAGFPNSIIPGLGQSIIPRPNQQSGSYFPPIGKDDDTPSKAVTSRFPW